MPPLIPLDLTGWRTELAQPWLRDLLRELIARQTMVDPVTGELSGFAGTPIPVMSELSSLVDVVGLTDMTIAPRDGTCSEERLEVRLDIEVELGLLTDCQLVGQVQVGVGSNGGIEVSVGELGSAVAGRVELPLGVGVTWNGIAWTVDGTLSFVGAQLVLPPLPIVPAQIAVGALTVDRNGLGGNLTHAFDIGGEQVTVAASWDGGRTLEPTVLTVTIPVAGVLNDLIPDSALQGQELRCRYAADGWTLELTPERFPLLKVAGGLAAAVFELAGGGAGALSNNDLPDFLDSAVLQVRRVKFDPLVALGPVLPALGCTVELALVLDVNIADAIRTTSPVRLSLSGLRFELDLGAEDLGVGVSVDAGAVRVAVDSPGTWQVAGAPDFDFAMGSAQLGADAVGAFLDLDLALALDLGVISVDTSTLRLPLNGATPTLSGFGASLDIGVLAGRGELSVGAELHAGLALEFSSLGIHVDGWFARGARDASTYLELGASWPVGLPLAATGLGLFGVRGVLGIGVERTVGNGSVLQRELDWWDDTRDKKYEDSPGSWVIGIGAQIGTLWDGGRTVSAEGILVIGVPELEVIWGVDADIFAGAGFRGLGEVEAARSGNGALQGLIAFDSSRPSFAALLQANIHLGALAHISIPFGLGFDATNGPSASVFIGDDGNDEQDRPLGPVSVELFPNGGPLQLRAWAFLMVSSAKLEKIGKGRFSRPIDLPGPALAFGAGFEPDWQIGPFRLSVWGKVLLGVGTQPFLIVGRLAIGGEIDLLIASVGVSAELDIRVGTDRASADGRLCGHLSLLFFEVKACMKFSIGARPPVPPPGPPVAAVRYVDGRARVATNRAADGTIVEAIDRGVGLNLGPGNRSGPPTVWPDTLPVLELAHTPWVPAGDIEADEIGVDVISTDGTAPDPEGFGSGEDRRVYKLSSVTLTDVTTGDTVPGPLPAAWVSSTAPDAAGPSLQLLNRDPLKATKTQGWRRFTRGVAHYETICERDLETARLCATGAAATRTAPGFVLLATGEPARCRFRVDGFETGWTPTGEPVEAPESFTWWARRFIAERARLSADGNNEPETWTIVAGGPDPTAGFGMPTPNYRLPELNGPNAQGCASGARLEFNTTITDPALRMAYSGGFDDGYLRLPGRKARVWANVAKAGATQWIETERAAEGETFAAHWVEFQLPKAERARQVRSLWLSHTTEGTARIQSICATTRSEQLRTKSQRARVGPGIGAVNGLVLEPGHGYRIDVDWAFAAYTGDAADAAALVADLDWTAGDRQSFEFCVANRGVMPKGAPPVQDVFDPAALARYIATTRPAPDGPPHFRCDPVDIDWFQTGAEIKGLLLAYRFTPDTEIRRTFPAPLQTEEPTVAAPPGWHSASRQPPLYEMVAKLPAFGPGGCLEGRPPVAHETETLAPSRALEPDARYECIHSARPLGSPGGEPVEIHRWTFTTSRYEDARRLFGAVLGTTGSVIRHVAPPAGVDTGQPGVWAGDDAAFLAALEVLDLGVALTNPGTTFIWAPLADGGWQLVTVALLAPEPMVRPGRCSPEIAVVDLGTGAVPLGVVAVDSASTRILLAPLTDVRVTAPDAAAGTAAVLTLRWSDVTGPGDVASTSPEPAPVESERIPR